MTKRSLAWLCAAFLMVGVASGCMHVGPPPPTEASMAEKWLAAPERPAADRDTDERRNALDSLAFMQPILGYTVLDIEAGAGYWTEIFSSAVGREGKVIMQNPAGFATMLKDPLAKRFEGGRLANVRQTFSNFDALDVPTASVDLVVWVQGPHELYYKPEQAPAGLGDPAKTYAEIARVLRPGGVFVAIDHSAVDGSPATTGGTLHRIDPAIVIAMAKKAGGLKLEARGTFLANPRDPRTANVFDPAIRGKTDQFALRFRKPKK